ncbi:S1C family serine protease [Candidatus Bipolaricaulota bacterium]
MSRTRGSAAAIGLAAVLSVAVVGQVAELQQAVMDVFDSAAPAVVHITVRGTAEDFMMQPVPVEGSGSGFLYDADGHIVTNFHVVEGAEEITVSFNRVECCPATVVGLDPSTDLAVIRVAPEELPTPLKLANSDAIHVGQFVVAIGNPFGLEQAMTFGIVSALGRVIQSPDGRFVGEAIQTDATINPGNSGGPLLDLEGRVVGVASQIISPVRGSSGIGFAIPSNMVARVADALIRDGRYAHPYLGLSGYGLSPELIQLFRQNDVPLPFEAGLMVTRVVADGPAMMAGLQAAEMALQLGGFEVPVGGDIVLAIDGNLVESMLDVILYLDLETQVRDTVVLRVLRDGEILELPLILGERPEATS